MVLALSLSLQFCFDISDQVYVDGKKRIDISLSHSSHTYLAINQELCDARVVSRFDRRRCVGVAVLCVVVAGDSSSA